MLGFRVKGFGPFRVFTGWGLRVADDRNLLRLRY